MKIFLTSQYDGQTIDVGVYHSSAVPRAGESIALITYIKDDGKDAYPALTNWRVEAVRHNANNVMQTKEWMVPFPQDLENDSVTLSVSPVSSDAAMYRRRLIQE